MFFFVISILVFVKLQPQETQRQQQQQQQLWLLHELVKRESRSLVWPANKQSVGVIGNRTVEQQTLR